VYVLKSLDSKALDNLLTRALKEDIVLSRLKIKINEKESLFRYSGGDARKLLNIIEIIVSNAKASKGGSIVIDNKTVKEKLQENISQYDKSGEMHYDIISAFIKSLRGSDPNGAIYWMARMLSAGEDPLFIARRMVVLAAEDIGLANPNALLLAEACFSSVHKTGMPEARIILSETALYLATSPKSNSAIAAIDSALQEVSRSGDLSVPLHLRNAPTKLMEELGYGKDYKYAHSYENNFVNQQYLPSEIQEKIFYEPGENPREADLRKLLERLWKRYNI